ncbi:cytochrome p450 oxidoreductase [Emericellopsis cladophorae]|uniref:Cytochrome p450 oxidoreductase n=1 Tax=Emericellopsis cladophorae TaxID=2686198 RepID=A0A9Q0BF60_9HYPO|nr:cytochrome p450 oxidoreductase [Emericellopsis cladophorae]KAI6783632.1 cytochrome p450 oxidoreductase [Emericellopsis cladophorae]
MTNLLGIFESFGPTVKDLLGPILRYGPNRYSICEPSAAKSIYGHGTQFAKSAWYSSWTTPGSWSLFPDQDIKSHAHGRSLFQSTYSMTALVSYEAFVDECGALICQRLQEIAENGESVDMRHWFQCYAFDVIGIITFGNRFGFLDRGEDVGSLIQALDGHLFYATLVGLLPSLHPLLYRIRNLWAGRKGTGRGYILSFTLEQIADHRAGADAKFEKETTEKREETRTEPFLSKFLVKHAEDPEKFSHQQHVVAACVSNVTAGSDTTAISLSAILYYLIKNPDCLLRLRVEIDEFQSRGQLSGYPSFKETQQMTYLQATIKEALRMHPATGLPLERVVPRDGIEIAGQYFPKGAIVGINTWVEHRNSTYFGQDADQFRPERWLIKDTEALSHMNQHWIPFGLGSRTCIGRHISMLEITKVIPRIVRDFDFELVSSEAGKEATWSTQNVWFVKPTDFIVRVKARAKMS